MPIASKEVIENKPLASGYDIHLQYTFTDGTVKDIKCRSPLITDAANYLISKESNILESKKNQDLDSQIQKDSDSPTSDTSQVEIYKAWMFKGYNSLDPIDAYTHLVKVAQKVIDLNLTAQQLATAFNEDVKTINLVLEKWQYLKSNKTEILAYKAVKDGVQ